jgi:paired amphipathic helix protein Sin3a
MARTLSLLEPLLRKLEETPIENLAGLRLPPNLGSPTPSIHQRIVKKIYGREAGLEIIQALQDAPAHALPVVVSRLRQKDEEWRRGQNEFSKMWRDVDTRNFYKSLDHQGITFKVNDKKGITTKSLVSQLESARAISLEQGTEMAYHIEFMLDDIDVVQDSMKLCLYALDRQPLSYSRFERKNIERFLRLFVPLLLMKDPNMFDAGFETSLPSADEDEMESEGEALNGEVDEGKGNINGALPLVFFEQM